MEMCEDMSVIKSVISNICLNKTLYVGFAALDLSKLHMYKFHDKNILEKYNDINLIFTDTDSLLYEIEAKDIYVDMIKDKDNYDFSDYPESHHCFQGMTAAEITHTRLVKSSW